MRKLSKATIALGTTAALVTGAGVAYAYWTTTGGGSGTFANKSTPNSTIALVASWNASALVPGSSQTVSFTAANPDPETDLRVRDITSVITTSDAGCLPAWFTMPVVNANQTIAHATGPVVPVALAVTGTLSFSNNASDQDPCKGANVTLTLTSN